MGASDLKTVRFGTNHMSKALYHMKSPYYRRRARTVVFEEDSEDSIYES